MYIQHGVASIDSSVNTFGPPPKKSFPEAKADQISMEIGVSRLASHNASVRERIQGIEMTEWCRPYWSRDPILRVPIGCHMVM